MSFPINELFRMSGKAALRRFWMFSDLQQRDLERAERYFTAAVSDYRSLALEGESKPDGICYLGDAAEGIDREALDTMIKMQLLLIDSLELPVFYTSGNHEFDCYFNCIKEQKPPCVPFVDAVRGKKNWHLPVSQEDFWYSYEFPEFIMLFFSDHAAKDGSWAAVHQHIRQGDAYPYTEADWLAVRDRFADAGKPVFTFSHYPFPGGNRPSEYLARLLPLPANFRAHFYGHAHIGDENWAAENLYRQISGVDNCPINQFDVSSLDHLRGTTVRTSFFDYYGDGEYGVFFRDCLNHRWEQAYFSAHDARSAGTPEKLL